MKIHTITNYTLSEQWARLEIEAIRRIITSNHGKFPIVFGTLDPRWSGSYFEVYILMKNFMVCIIPFIIHDYKNNHFRGYVKNLKELSYLLYGHRRVTFIDSRSHLLNYKRLINLMGIIDGDTPDSIKLKYALNSDIGMNVKKIEIVNQGRTQFVTTCIQGDKITIYISDTGEDSPHKEHAKKIEKGSNTTFIIR